MTLHLLRLLLLLAFASPTAAAVPDQPPLDPSCTLFEVSRGTECVYEARDVRVVAPGDVFTLSQGGGGDYSMALGCGSDACIWWGNAFKFFNFFFAPGVGIAGDCPAYAGLTSPGGTTRPITPPPGLCKVRYDPFTLRAPGQWALVNSFATRGIQPQEAVSHLIAVAPEWFQVFVVAVDPLDAATKKKPNFAYALRPGGNATHAQCLSQLTVSSWLPDRVVPDCVRLGEFGLSNFLPDGLWDVYGFQDPTPPTGSLRAAPTPWTPGRVRVQGDTAPAQVTRIPNPGLSMSMELLGGDNIVGLREDDTARVTLRTSSAGVAGNIRGIGFSSGRDIVRVQRTSTEGSVQVSPQITVFPTQGYEMGPGEALTFDVPIRGTSVGPLRLFAAGGGLTRWFGEDRIASVTLPIEVVIDPPPPVRPTTVCGFDVFTFVGASSTFSTLVVESANGIEVGTELVVDPCTPDAEEVTVGALDGTSLTVSPAMQKVHPKNTPIIRRPQTTTTLPGAVTTTTTTTTTMPPAGMTTTTTLPPCTSARCRVDDAVGGAACDGAAPPASLTKKVDQ
jgi:hypothetical protein